MTFSYKVRADNVAGSSSINLNKNVAAKGVEEPAVPACDATVKNTGRCGYQPSEVICTLVGLTMEIKKR